MKNNKENRGFTLLELLIVIAIIAILAVVIIIVLDPAETLRKSRDAQRMSDLSTVKTALGIYTTSTSSPQLAGASSSTICKTATAGSAGSYTAADLIYYSTSDSLTDATLDGGSGSQPAANTVAATAAGNTDGTGWIPVNLDSLTSGSPISNFPIDPVNTVAAPAAIASTDLVYRYICSTAIQYEIDAQLESSAYTVTDDKRAKDGGNNAALYEVGTNLKLLGTGVDF
jgi:prepilin-type N-terminal cleavage/methylation domain-containing protein